MRKKMDVKNVIGSTVQEIADDCGLQKPEVSLALRGKRRLGTDKLMQVHLAGYPLELFVFGLDWCIENGVEIKGKVARPAGERAVTDTTGKSCVRGTKITAASSIANGPVESQGGTDDH